RSNFWLREATATTFCISTSCLVPSLNSQPSSPLSSLSLLCRSIYIRTSRNTTTPKRNPIIRTDTRKINGQFIFY
ncbi:MAG: hypothetical protein KAX31_01110, partial [Thermoplasmata archaeon]|nr:hypothetical protein [Thermoplasmata archaeon]